jgi:hypothetical protein
MNTAGEKPRKDYIEQAEKLIRSPVNSTLDHIERFLSSLPFLRNHTDKIGKWLVIFVASIIFVVGLIDYFSSNKPVVSPLPDSGVITSSQNLSNSKVQKALQEGCNTSNNFEPNIWDTRAMRVVERDPDTGDPISYAAQQGSSFQSLMLYKVQCPLPLIATASAEMQSKNSLGLIFEYDNVFQVIIGDGDTRSIRYKVHSEEKRQIGWNYVYGQDGNKITHWLPNGQKIVPGSEVGLTVQARIVGNGEIEIKVSLSYKPVNGDYTGVSFPAVQLKTYKYDTVQNIGRPIRVGLNDFSFEGNEAIFVPLHFSVMSGGI